MYGLLNIQDHLFRTRIERLFGVPICTIVGENDAEKYYACRATDRICKYWNPNFKPGDETFFSFLELLYSNKSQHSYFTLLGIVCFLKLLVSNNQILKYVTELPGPTPELRQYVDWINDFFFNFSKI
jgi:hypothetical protein